MGDLQMDAPRTLATRCLESTIPDHQSTFLTDPMPSRRLQHSYREDTIKKGCDSANKVLALFKCSWQTFLEAPALWMAFLESATSLSLNSSSAVHFLVICSRTSKCFLVSLFKSSINP